MARGARPGLVVVVRRAAAVAAGLGALVYGFMAYSVLQAGGFTTTSLLSACAEAATGRAYTGYRMGERLDVEHRFLPPSASCRWSGGTSVTLVDLGWWGWVGPALLVAGTLTLVVLRLSDRRPGVRP